MDGILHQYFTCFFWIVWGKNTTKFTEPSQEPGLNFLLFIVRKKGKMSIINWIRAMIQALGERGDRVRKSSGTCILSAQGEGGGMSGVRRGSEQIYGILASYLSMMHLNFSWKEIHKHWDIIWHSWKMYLGEGLNLEAEWCLLCPYVVSVTILSRA